MFVIHTRVPMLYTIINWANNGQGKRQRHSSDSFISGLNGGTKIEQLSLNIVGNRHHLNKVSFTKLGVVLDGGLKFSYHFEQVLDNTGSILSYY